MNSRRDQRKLKPVIDPETGQAKRDSAGKIIKDPDSAPILRPTREARFTRKS